LVVEQQMNKKGGLRDKALDQLKRSGKSKYIRIFCWTLLVSIIAAYNIIFLPSVFEKIVKSQFEKYTNGKINLHVLQSSLLRGFRVEKIEILSGEDFNRRPLLKMDRFNLTYSIYGFFAGDFGFHEIGLYNPQVFLYHRGSIWNSSTLAKRSGKKEPEKEKAPEKKSAGLSLPVQIRGFVKFVLQNFSLTIVDLDSDIDDGLETGLKDFTLKTYIITKKFSYFPYDISAVDIFKSIVVNLDPQKTIDIYFRDKNARVKSPLDMHWLVTFDNNLKKEGFYSRLIVGHHDVPVLYKGKHLLPMNFGMDYNMKYDPQQDRMDLAFFKITFGDNLWMNLAGAVLHPSDSQKTNLQLNVNQSNIDIGKLLPYYKTFTGDENMDFKGEISLAPLKISGALNNLDIAGKFSLFKFNMDMGDKNISFDYLDLDYHMIVDKYLEKSLIPKVRQARISWSGVFNGSPLGAEIEYQLNEKVNLHAYIRKFNPEPFSSDKLSGVFDADFRLSGKNQKNLSSVLSLKSPYFVYYVDRGVSGINQMDLSVKTNILFTEDGYSSMQVNIPDISFYMFNEKNRKTMELLAAIQLNKTPDDMAVNFTINRFSTNFKNLKPSLPGSYREKIESYAENSEKDIRLSGTTQFQKKGDYMQTQNVTNVFIDDLDINDVVFKTQVIMDGSTVNIPQMTLSGLNNALQAKLNGKLAHVYQKDETQDNTSEKQMVWMPDLKYSFKLGKNEKTRIFQGYTIAGIMDLNGIAKNYIIDGNLAVKKLYYDNGNFTRINNVNLDFPFYHDRRLKKSLNLTGANKERIIKNFSGEFKYNLTIDSVEIPNPTRIKEPLKILYPSNGMAGLSAAMRYKDNVFEMPMMQIFMLNGLIAVQDTLFNVGRGNMDEMQYRSMIQIKNIDLKLLLPADKATSVADGKISLDGMMTASSMKNIMSDTSGYLSVYKVGKQFAMQGLRVVMPDSSSFMKFIVDDKIIIQKFDFDFKEGLVYVRISYTKGFIANLIGPEGNELNQEKIPVSTIFEKAGGEVKIYQTDRIKPAETSASE